MSDSNKFPTDFIPVSRPLAKELGYQAAYVFGVIWNYCQMESGICNASHDSIAERADMGRRTVMRHIETLIKKGYIEDLTPEVTNAPHHLCTKIGVSKLHSGRSEVGQNDLAARPKLPSEVGQNGTQIESINRQNQESEDTPAVAHMRDPLTDALELQGTIKDESDSNPEDQYYEYRSDFLAIYQEMAGKYPDTTIKDEVGKLIARGVTVKVWAESWRQCKLNYPGPNGPTLARVIEVCDHGGNYEKWREWKHPPPSNGRDSPVSPPKPALRIVPVGSDE